MKLDKQAEALLVEGLRSGKESAMRDFYAHYAGYLTAVCARYVPWPDDLKDVLHDALLKVFTRIGDFSYQGPGSLKAWASRVVVNESLLFLRQKKRLVFAADDLSEAEEDVAVPAEGLGMPVLQQMIQQLPDGYRTVFNLFVFEGMPHADIARQLGISTATSASQYHRAKKMLQKSILEYKKKNGL